MILWAYDSRHRIRNIAANHMRYLTRFDGHSLLDYTIFACKLTFERQQSRKQNDSNDPILQLIASHSVTDYFKQ